MPTGDTLERAVQDFLKALAANPQLTPEVFCDGFPGVNAGLLPVLLAITSSNDGSYTLTRTAVANG